jgi:hypothetical protein
MNRLFKLQFLGPLALFVATLCAELAARALEYVPSSEVLWFVNLRMFGIFQRSDAILSYFVPINGFQFFGLALPIFLLACLGLASKSRVPFTIATHLSVAYALFLAASWQMFVQNATQASLGPITVPSGFGPVPPGVGLYVIAAILGSCLLSFAITHVLYLRAVGHEIGAAVRWAIGYFRTFNCVNGSASDKSC